MLNFKLEKFEGPLSLLLKLIEKEELDITQISLAKIADQYIDYIRTSPNITPDNMADFLLVASRLLLIKSRALLPYLYPEEEKEIEELEEQLRMYKEYVEAMKKINVMIGKKKFMFAREFNRKVILAEANLFSPPKNIKAEDLAMIFVDLLTRLQPPEKLEEGTIDDLIKIEDKILSIQRMLADRIMLSFNQILVEAKSKTEIIVSFLAMLELMRQKEVNLVQEELFSEILISKYEETLRDEGANV
ncbi:MAG: Segregation and condensation protein A [Parcubacteria group bacterium ADurb.Bin316]|nr:MAG: Segregation and condensation protein A [Parcubacteria group bacterium ADurb.Bin316]HOZ56095.1 segregation/condensation protein A [bacterium]